MIEKGSIKRSFSKAARTYDANASVQRLVADDLTELIRFRLGPCRALAANSGEPAASGNPGRGVTSPRVLDVGTGTGRLISNLMDVLPEAKVVAIDMALPMVKKALENQALPGPALLVSDCEDLPFGDSGFDAVVSSLTYQWVMDIGRAFSEAARVLAPGGLFIFSTLGPETLKELRHSYKEALKRLSVINSVRWLPLRSSDEIRKAITDSGLSIHIFEGRHVRATYKDFFDLLRTIKGIGASPAGGNGFNGLGGGAVLREAGRVYSERFPSGSGGIAATYDIITVVASKTL